MDFDTWTLSWLLAHLVGLFRKRWGLFVLHYCNIQCLWHKWLRPFRVLVRRINLCHRLLISLLVTIGLVWLWLWVVAYVVVVAILSSDFLRILIGYRFWRIAVASFRVLFVTVHDTDRLLRFIATLRFTITLRLPVAVRRTVAWRLSITLWLPITLRLSIALRWSITVLMLSISALG